MPTSDNNRSVREPIQVYLTEEERGLLDTLAEEGDISRAEVLRRAIRSFAREQAAGESAVFDLATDLMGDDWPQDIATRHDDHLAESGAPKRRRRKR